MRIEVQKKLPSGDWNEAGAVVDYFLGILCPGEGRANLDLYHQSALQFLNTDVDGVTSSPFNTLGQGSEAYDQRVRGMVAMLMSFQRFQEQ